MKANLMTAVRQPLTAREIPDPQPGPGQVGDAWHLEGGTERCQPPNRCFGFDRVPKRSGFRPGGKPVRNRLLYVFQNNINPLCYDPKAQAGSIEIESLEFGTEGKRRFLPVMSGVREGVLLERACGDL